MMRQTLQPSLIAGGSGRTILIAGGERGVIYYGAGMYGLSQAVFMKAQQYGVWREVRQWAKEHPLAVKFVNQDTDMIHSIAHTGWTRWIVSLNRARINLGPIITETSCSVNAKVKNMTNSSTGVFGTRVDGDYSRSYLMLMMMPTGWRGDWAESRSTTYGSPLLQDKEYEIEVRKGLLVVNGQTFINTQSPSAAICSNDFYVMDSYATNAWASNANSYLKFHSSTRDIHLLPCVSEGVNGMVDVISGTFYPNANTTGSFTIDLTQDS